MCTASNCSSLLLITAFLTIIMCSRVLNGHPLKAAHQDQLLSKFNSDDNDPPDDILAGAEFLSLFMQSTRLRESMTTTSTTDFPATTTTILGEDNQDNNLLDDVSNLIRTSRSALDASESSTVVDNLTSDNNKNNIIINSNNNNIIDSNNNIIINNNDNYQILKVRVSTSISSNHNPGLVSAQYPPKNELLDRNSDKNIKIQKEEFSSRAHAQDQIIVASDPQPEVIISSARKSDFPVEESAPITRNHDDTSDLLTSEFARPFNLPNFETKPYQTVIYHDNQDGGHARSVSYSTVIRQMPKTPPEVTPSPAAAESNFYVVTMKPEGDASALQRTNNRTESAQATPTSAPSWKPKIYGEPEKNYEIDEAVNVKTNGRAHGVVSVNAPPVSPSANSENGDRNKQKEEDDNQKVGYVVEGRNFRKYRVEERTPDGFIVGEYGVVSHDDGSLRGVRYTADGTINPRLIYDALMKFLSL